MRSASLRPLRHLRRSNHTLSSLLLHTQLISTSFNHTQLINSPFIPQPHPSITKPLFNPLYFSSIITPNSNLSTPKAESPQVHNYNEDDDDGDEDEDGLEEMGIKDEKLVENANAIMGILAEFASNGVEAKRKLEECGIDPTTELVVEVLSRIRNDWSAAYTFFLWAGSREGYDHSVRAYHSMISILGKMRRFDTAWALIDEMRRRQPSLVSPQTLLIMIRGYSAAHDVGRAINTFYAHKRFKFEVGIEEFQDLLGALCRYKNVQDAEHLLFCNEKVYPLTTKSFNIILNGWCNMVVNLGHAKRFWRLMGEKGIARDTVSYSSMISCYSKISNLHEVLKLFNQMKEMGISPDRKIYNGVIHALAKGKLVKEACELLKTMEEKGFVPNAVTYTSLIKPLCKAGRTDNARVVFNEMLQKGLSPTIRTYHALFDIVKTGDEAFELLEKMKEAKCHPVNDTYIMLIRKFCRWRQIENVFRLWSEMGESGLSYDRSSYIVLVHGLFLNGKLEEAWKYYEEMKEKGFLPEPKTEEMLQAYSNAKQAAAMPDTSRSPSRKYANVVPTSSGSEKDFLKLPETRKVTRERGFSLWK